MGHRRFDRYSRACCLPTKPFSASIRVLEPSRDARATLPIVTGKHSMLQHLINVLDSTYPDRLCG